MLTVALIIAIAIGAPLVYRFGRTAGRREQGNLADWTLRASNESLTALVDQHVETIGVWKRTAEGLSKERDAATKRSQDLERQRNDLQRINDRLTLAAQRAREHLAELEVATDSP